MAASLYINSASPGTTASDWQCTVQETDTVWSFLLSQSVSSSSSLGKGQLLWEVQSTKTDTFRCAEIGQPDGSAALFRCQANTYLMPGTTVHAQEPTFQPTVLKASQFSGRFYQFRSSRILYCNVVMWSHNLVQRCLGTAGWTTTTTIREVERTCDDEEWRKEPLATPRHRWRIALNGTSVINGSTWTELNWPRLRTSSGWGKEVKKRGVS